MLRCVVAMFVLWAWGVPSQAQELGRSEIMLSRGTIFKFRESLSPRSNADAFNGGECQTCHFILAPGEFALIYPERRPALPAGRIPVVTKTGVFGSVRGFSDSGYEYLVAEAEIVRMQAERADRTKRITDWLITVRPHLIERELYFTRGEILPMETVGDVAIVKIRKNDPRFAQKYAELRNYRAALPATAQSRITIDDAEARIDIGRDDLDDSPFVKINFEEFAELLARRPSGWGSPDLSARWPRMVKSPNPSLRVTCNEEVILSSSMESENTRKARAGFELGLKDVVKFFELDLGASIDLAEKYKQSIASTEKIVKKGFDLNSIALLSPADGVSVAHIGNEVICTDGGSSGTRLFRAAVPGLGDWAVTLDTYQRIAKTFAKDNALTWEDTSGKLLVKCYQAGYMKLKGFLGQIVSNEAFTDAFLTQTLKIDRPQPGRAVDEFFSC